MKWSNGWPNLGYGPPLNETSRLDPTGTNNRRRFWETSVFLGSGQTDCSLLQIIKCNENRIKMIAALIKHALYIPISFVYTYLYTETTVFALKVLPLDGSKYLTNTVHLRFSSTIFGLTWSVKNAQLLRPAWLVLSKNYLKFEIVRTK